MPLLAESLELALCTLPACSDHTVKSLCGAANTVRFIIGRGWECASAAAAAELVAGERLCHGLITCEHLSQIPRRAEKIKSAENPATVIKKWVSSLELNSPLAGQRLHGRGV